MKYIYILIIPVLFFVGCTSSESEKVDKEIKEMKKLVETLKERNKENDKILDSLKNETKTKDEQILFFQQQLDSLNKNLKEEELK